METNTYKIWTICVCACVRSCGKVGVCEFVSEGEKAREEGELESLGKETL